MLGAPLTSDILADLAWVNTKKCSVICLMSYGGGQPIAIIVVTENLCFSP